MRKLLTSIYIGELEPERTFKLLSRYQVSNQLSRTHVPAPLIEALEANLKGDQQGQEEAMVETGIIDI